MQITNQKRMAAQLLKCGVNRVWIDHHHIDEIAQSVRRRTFETISSVADRGQRSRNKPSGGEDATAQRARASKGHGRRRDCQCKDAAQGGLDEDHSRTTPNPSVLA